MSKFSTNKILFICSILAVAVLSCVFVSYTKAAATYQHLNKTCCRKMEQKAADMPWEAISKHFVSAVLFR